MSIEPNPAVNRTSTRRARSNSDTAHYSPSSAPPPPKKPIEALTFDLAMAETVEMLDATPSITTIINALRDEITNLRNEVKQLRDAQPGNLVAEIRDLKEQIQKLTGSVNTAGLSNTGDAFTYASAVKKGDNLASIQQFQQVKLMQAANREEEEQKRRATNIIISGLFYQQL